MPPTGDTRGQAGDRAMHPLPLSIYALLAGNTLWYAVSGPWTKALDSVAWFALLLLFAIETGAGRPGGWPGHRHARRLLHALRLLAAAAIAASAGGYLRDHAWLDAINVGLWLLVVALLECELRMPVLVAKQRRLFTTGAVVLYAGIALLIPLWALRGEWFDAWDGVLWLVAFALIEMDVLKLAR